MLTLARPGNPLVEALVSQQGDVLHAALAVYFAHDHFSEQLSVAIEKQRQIGRGAGEMHHVSSIAPDDALLIGFTDASDL